jgi:hypothetical protein
MTRTTGAAVCGDWTRGVVGVAAACLIAVSAPCEGATSASRPVANVALDGDVAPNTGGATFTNFDEPMVNASGQVAFVGVYSGGGAGVFLQSGGSLSSVVVSGDSITGIGTVVLTGAADIDGPAINNKGTVAFVIKGATTKAVVLKTLVGAPTVLVKVGDAAPGTTGVFAFFDDMSLNNNDDVAFIATYTEDGGTTFKTGAWLKPSGGALTKIIAHGDPVPAGIGTCPSGFTSTGSTGDIDGPWMNDQQVVVFLIDGPCGGNPSTGGDHILVKQPAQSLAAFVTEGDPAPASIGGTIGGFKLGRPALNNLNTLAYRAVEITGGSVAEAVVTHTLGGSPVSCVKLGDNAPGTTGTISTFADIPPTINQSGRLDFAADVSGDPNVSRGLFTCQNGTVAAIAFSGDPMPGTTSSVFSSHIGEASMSDDGRVAFLDDNFDSGLRFGVFVSPQTQAEAIPTLSEWAYLGMVALLVLGGLLALRRRRAPSTALVP